MQTGSADYFTGLRNSLTGLGIDALRAKLIDVEQVKDTRNVPDSIDVREGQAGGFNVASLLLIGGAVILGVVLLKRVL